MHYRDPRKDSVRWCCYLTIEESNDLAKVLRNRKVRSTNTLIRELLFDWRDRDIMALCEDTNGPA